MESDFTSPCLHNEPVPTLWNLLKPPAERPEFFYRGSDLYDFVNVGFVSSKAETKPPGSDTIPAAGATAIRVKITALI
jgi:RoxA-like, cytochrome c-like